MLKIAIVGCGKIADSHARQIQQIEACQIVAACDREPLMAQQFSERFGVKQCFTELKEALKEAKPDVVHITTPPQSHFHAAIECLNAGSHVYVEKPFTLCAEEAEEILALADQRRLRVTVGHDQQFTPVARRMRELVRSGYIGTPLHMESTWCYDLGNMSYARALLGDKRHWVRALPGQLLQNIISHGIAKVAEFLKSDLPRVHAAGFVSPVLSELGEDIIDELRVIITERDTTAYFTFSSQMRPSTHQFCVYGTKNGICIDEDRQTLLRLPGRKHKSYVEKFVPPLTQAGQLVRNWMHNAKLFLRGDFDMDSGKKYLIKGFYDSITRNAPSPIPDREILLTSRIMDAIFEQVCTGGTALNGPKARFEDRGAPPPGTAALKHNSRLP